ncbi:MAG: hypothetical protein IIB38_08130 [Candidatus Hydrogenedentes bacterium]|nr:hypothetical protein [Candidatus Hydrogenedentota bacterium]
MKHTQGEWSLPHFADPTCKCDCRWILSEGCCGSIATINVDNGKRIIDGGNDSPPLEEAIANARLIHAAPDMLAALRALVRSTSSTNFIPAKGYLVSIPDKVVAVCDAAIAKAERANSE